MLRAEIRGIVCDVADPASVEAAAEANFSPSATSIAVWPAPCSNSRRCSTPATRFATPSASSLCSIEGGHPFVPTCLLAERRAQPQSRVRSRMRRHRRSRRKASLTECWRSDPPKRSGFAWTHCWRELDSNLRSLSKPEILLPRYAQVIHIMQTYLGAGAAMVQPFFCGASNHSTEPGWGTV